ncbi:zeta toxin family protein [Nonomuraea sp. NEAU-L178]|nr:zeta toxin family protein [Nonomuraea aurantiaca]
MCLLAGAPAAGKTTLLPYLLRAANGLVVMDMDELLEIEGAMADAAQARALIPVSAPIRVFLRLHLWSRRKAEMSARVG